MINSLFFFVFRNLIFIQTFPVYPTFGTRIHSGAGIFVAVWSSYMKETVWGAYVCTLKWPKGP